MTVSFSPLRYPGGKQILANLLAHVIQRNGLIDPAYAEPYAGGAGAALWLLYTEHVSRALINDADPGIFAFWHSVLEKTEDLVDRVVSARVSPREWRRQRSIYQRRDRRSRLSLGFATFFLNRCNRSGIIATGGMIGGKAQKSEWGIDARFNKDELVKRIRRIAMYRQRIELTNLDAIDFIKTRVLGRAGDRPTTFVYLDPPYYRKGKELYLNFYKAKDHGDLSQLLRHERRFPWLLSYDNVAPVKRLYEGLRQVEFGLGYSAQRRRMGRELMIVPPHVVWPAEWAKRIPPTCVSSADRVPMPSLQAAAIGGSR